MSVLSEKIGCVQHDCAECKSRGWIDVNDRLPKDHPRRCYLVAYVGSAHGTPRRVSRRVLFAIYSGGKWRFMGPQKETRLSERVTHWMRKPRPPRLPSARSLSERHLDSTQAKAGSTPAERATMHQYGKF